MFLLRQQTCGSCGAENLWVLEAINMSLLTERNPFPARHNRLMIGTLARQTGLMNGIKHAYCR